MHHDLWHYSRLGTQYSWYRQQEQDNALLPGSSRPGKPVPEINFFNSIGYKLDVIVYILNHTAMASVKVENVCAQVYLREVKWEGHPMPAGSMPMCGHPWSMRLWEHGAGLTGSDSCSTGASQIAFHALGC